MSISNFWWHNEFSSASFPTSRRLTISNSISISHTLEVHGYFLHNTHHPPSSEWNRSNDSSLSWYTEHTSSKPKNGHRSDKSGLRECSLPNTTHATRPSRSVRQVDLHSLSRSLFSVMKFFSFVFFSAENPHDLQIECVPVSEKDHTNLQRKYKNLKRANANNLEEARKERAEISSTIEYYRIEKKGVSNWLMPIVV